MVMQLADIQGAAPLTEERLRQTCPYYHLVPKTRAANLAFRKRLIELAAKDKRYAMALREMCKRDVLFFINAFVYCVEPRELSNPVKPMITWRSQDHVILELHDSLGRYNVWGQKSRAEAFTWDVMVLYDWLLLFHKNRDMGVASREAGMVDDSSNRSSLLPKIDEVHKRLPEFLKPRIERTMMKIVNSDMGSAILGFTTTEDIARGGRLYSFYPDEFGAFKHLARAFMSSASQVTNNCIFGSTHKGTGTVFYENTTSGDKKVLTVHWTTNPYHARGLYTYRDGKLEILDKDFRGKVLIEHKEYLFPDEYPFERIRAKLSQAGMNPDGRLLSPYYDNTCEKLNYNRVLIAQEMDISPEESGANVFPRELVDKLVMVAQGRRPMHTGNPRCDWTNGDWLDWSDNAKGMMRLWAPVISGRMAPAEYVLGIDVATGAGSTMNSNSVISIGNKWTREKVGELATPKLRPDRLAIVACAVGRWLAYRGQPALIIWEDNGPGKTFKQVLINELGYENYYKRKNHDKIGEPTSALPGWWSGVETKRTVLEQLLAAYESEHFVNPSPEACSELRHYVYDADGGITQSQSVTTDDPTGAKKNHGDRVIADALMWDQVRGHVGEADREDEPPEPPVDSLAWRRQERYAREREEVQL